MIIGKDQAKKADDGANAIEGEAGEDGRAAADRIRQRTIDQRAKRHAGEKQGDDQLPVVGVGGAQFGGDLADGRKHGVDRHRHQRVEHRHEDDEFKGADLAGCHGVPLAALARDGEFDRRWLPCASTADSKTVSLDPVDPAFYNNPYPAYRRHPRGGSGVLVGAIWQLVFRPP